MWIALERAKTAREAIEVMTKLVDEFGYASTGESFSIADPNEAWILEIIGKGEKQKGAVWVAVKVPDGTISAHANQPRIRQFPRNDPKNVLFSKDVVSFAREKGWFTGEGRGVLLRRRLRAAPRRRLSAAATRGSGASSAARRRR